MEENKISGREDLYNFKAAHPPSAQHRHCGASPRARRDREVTLQMSHVGSFGDSSRLGQLSISAQLVQMVLTTQQHDKGIPQELSHSKQWGCYLGWGDVGGDTALLCLIKINSGEIKKKPTLQFEKREE